MRREVAHPEQGEESILELLMAVSALVSKRCDQYLTQHHAMTLPQYLALQALKQGRARTVGQLADALNCSRGNLTGVTDRLERDGRIVRTRGTEDRRVIEVALTDRGHDVAEIHAALMAEIGKIQRVWSAAESAAVTQALERLLHHLTEGAAQSA